MREDDGEADKREKEVNRKSDLTLETVILPIYGIFMTLFVLLGP